MYEADVAREYLRDRFMDGTLDVTGSFESLRGFVQIFADDYCAALAIQFASDDMLADGRARELLAILKPDQKMKEELAAFYERAKG